MSAGFELIDKVAEAARLYGKAKEQADDALLLLSTRMQRVAELIVQDGDVIHRVSPERGIVSVRAGNPRGVDRFVVRGKPSVEVSHRGPVLWCIAFDAAPMNAAGKVISGRAGNSTRSGDRRDLVCLTLPLLLDRRFDDARSEFELLLDAAKRGEEIAAQRSAGGSA